MPITRMAPRMTLVATALIAGPWFIANSSSLILVEALLESRVAPRLSAAALVSKLDDLFPSYDQVMWTPGMMPARERSLGVILILPDYRPTKSGRLELGRTTR